MYLRICSFDYWTHLSGLEKRVRGLYLYWSLSFFILDPRIDSIRTLFTDKPIANITYMQGMNVLAAPFLMVMPEMDAFFAFSTFIYRWCPLYVLPTMRGVHCGIRVSLFHSFFLVLLIQLAFWIMFTLIGSYSLWLSTWKESISHCLCITS